MRTSPADRRDRALLIAGYTAVIACAVLQYHRHNLWFQLPNPNAATTTREALPTNKEQTNPVSSHHRSGIRSRSVARTNRTLRNLDAAQLRAQTHHRKMALGSAMARPRCDRPAGVRLEPLLELSRQSRLRIRRVELMRHSAGESVSGGVAGTSRLDVAGSGSLADRLRRTAVWLTGRRLQLQACEPLVLIALFFGRRARFQQEILSDFRWAA